MSLEETVRGIGNAFETESRTVWALEANSWADERGACGWDWAIDVRAGGEW